MDPLEKIKKFVMILKENLFKVFYFFYLKSKLPRLISPLFSPIHNL